MMGSACCCIGVPDIDTLANENSSIRRANFLCYNGCILGLVHMYQALFERGSRVPSSDEESVPLDSETELIGSSATNSSDGGMPDDPNTRFPLVSGDAVARGQDRGSSHSHVEPEPFCMAVQRPPKLSKIERKLVNAYEKGEFQECCSDTPLKTLSTVLNGVEYVVPSEEEEEDVCPTCLEEYTKENPKIITHCSHHYHLSCIYEWMERSETCPICGKVMEFDE